jgi:hypothetical protein
MLWISRRLLCRLTNVTQSIKVECYSRNELIILFGNVSNLVSKHQDYPSKMFVLYQGILI